MYRDRRKKCQKHNVFLPEIGITDSFHLQCLDLEEPTFIPLQSVTENLDEDTAN